MPLQKLLLEFEPKPENLLWVLKKIQKENKYIGKEECEQIADYFSLPLARVFSLASFFDELETRKQKKIMIKVCSGATCTTKKNMSVVRQLEMLLRTSTGSDAHPKYKLEFMSCRGLCDRGPVIMVGENTFEKVSPEMVDDIIKNYL